MHYYRIRKSLGTYTSYSFHRFSRLKDTYILAHKTIFPIIAQLFNNILFQSIILMRTKIKFQVRNIYLKSFVPQFVFIDHKLYLKLLYSFINTNFYYATFTPLMNCMILNRKNGLPSYISTNLQRVSKMSV